MLAMGDVHWHSMRIGSAAGDTCTDPHSFCLAPAPSQQRTAARRSSPTATRARTTCRSRRCSSSAPCTTTSSRSASARAPRSCSTAASRARCTTSARCSLLAPTRSARTSRTRRSARCRRQASLRRPLSSQRSRCARLLLLRLCLCSVARRACCALQVLWQIAHPVQLAATSRLRGTPQHPTCNRRVRSRVT
jgi:hypothetical protein